MITWNSEVKFILADVDETVAEVYTPAVSEMITELERLLRDGISLYFVSGGSLESINERIVWAIDPQLRKKILVAHCSGVEVWGYDDKGDVLKEAYYSLYDNLLSQDQKRQYREVINQLIKEFQLKTFPPMGSKPAFREKTNHAPHAIMYVDRGPQITFQLTNAYDLTEAQARELGVPRTHGQYDMRYPIIARSKELFQQHNIPITARTGGTTAIDFAVKGVSKTTAVRWIMENDELLHEMGLDGTELQKNPNFLEIWGDKFSTIHGGTDRHICEGLDKDVRAIDFREEDPNEFIPGYNIQVWHGKEHLHSGLLEYLKSRHI